MSYDFSQLPKTPPRGVTGNRPFDKYSQNDKPPRRLTWKLYRSEHNPADKPAYLPAVDAVRRDDA